jgi:hypothetical protein
MQEHPWEALLRRIPADYHDGLTIATVGGAELVVQQILKMDGPMLILRGRNAGSSEQGKILVISFTQINYVAFKKRLIDAEVEAIFGDRDANFAALPVALPVSEQAETPALEDEPAPANGTEPATAPAGHAKVSKSILLAKLRARLQGDSSKGQK